MAAVGDNQVPLEDSGLRERASAKPQHIDNAEDARQRVLQLNEEEESKQEKDKRTYGRTPDGTGKSTVALQQREE